MGTKTGEGEFIHCHEQLPHLFKTQCLPGANDRMTGHGGANIGNGTFNGKALAVIKGFCGPISRDQQLKRNLRGASGRQR